MNNKQEIKKEIDDLRNQLEKWSYEYYVLDNPSVDDSVYDKTMIRLQSLENQYPEFKTTNSISNRVGGFVSDKFIKRKHLHKMLSLDNAFDQPDLIRFETHIKESSQKPIEYIVEPKIDGLSISLIYKNSKLEYALTRGDGIHGEDVTANIYTIKSIPLFIDEKYKDEVVEIRGEVFIDKYEFEKINNELKESNTKLFANPRNAAAGSLRNLNSSICASRNLKAYFYYCPNPEAIQVSTQEELINWLKDNKFPTAEYIKKANSMDDVNKQIEYLSSIRDSIDFQIDGIVIKYNFYDQYDEIGYTAKFPKWAIAYKFKAEIGLSKIIDIFGDVGRTGKITYVAEIEPILLDGSMISKVSINNPDYIKQKDIRLNDYAFVYKAGDIIPYLDFIDLTRRPKDSKSFVPYKTCPCCKHELVHLNNEIDQRCINPNCKTQIIKKISYYCERDCMNIVGISEAIILRLYENNIIKDVSDLYDLKNKKDEVLACDINIKDKLFTNITNAIEQSKNNSLEHLINGLSIRLLGKTSSKKIAKHFKTLDNLMKASFEETASIFEIGEQTANEIYQYFKNKDNLELIEKLVASGINTEYVSTISNQVDLIDEYVNKKFVITGTFEIPRDKIKQYLEDVYSAKILNTVSKNVDYVLVGDNPGSKLQKANELKIPIISDISFIK